MSRVKRLKERKRKNRIKTTCCGLALALAVGSAQGLGTYALFTDIENVPSDISLSTGDVDVEVEEGTHLTDIEPDRNIEMPVKIINKGTLRQNIKLDISIFGSENIEKYLTSHSFVFNGITVEEDGIMLEGTDLFVLEPGKSINGKLIITVKDMDKETQNNLAGKTQNINLTVKSTQISSNNKEVFENGFYDIATQENTITIAQKEIITVAVGEKAHYINKNGNNYTSLFIPVNVNGITEENKDNITITTTIKDSIASYKAEYVDRGEYKYIKIIPETNEYIEFQDALNITINIKIGEDDEYSQLCWVKQDNAHNSNCEGKDNHPQWEETKRCQIQVVNNGHKNWSTLEEPLIPEVVEPPKEEVEPPSDPEVVEPPKEEVEIPSDPEVVEPPKEEIEVPTEPETVEPPKEEITEIPKQPEVIQPPKEDEEIQE